MTVRLQTIRAAILAVAVCASAALAAPPVAAQPAGSVSDPVATAIAAELDTLMAQEVDSIQGTPKSTPPSRVRHWCRASHRMRRSASSGGAASGAVA